MNTTLFVKRNLGPHRHLSAVLAILLLIVISSVAAANPLATNGSFETPIVPAGGFTNFGTGSTSITGWTVVGQGVSVVSGSFVSGCCIFPASDGLQWLDLTGGAVNQVSGVEQTVATVPGQAYGMTFNWANVVGTTSTWSVLVNGRDFLDIINTCTPCANTLTWRTNGVFFVASGSSTVIEFLGKSDATSPNSDGLGSVTGLDNVMLSPATLTPEPATLGLLALGLAGVGLFRRRCIKG